MRVHSKGWLLTLTLDIGLRLKCLAGQISRAYSGAVLINTLKGFMVECSISKDLKSARMFDNM
jgi:hypothetical protein